MPNDRVSTDVCMNKCSAVVRSANVNSKGQTMMEYLLVATTVVITVFLAFSSGNSPITRAHNEANAYLTYGGKGIVGGYYCATSDQLVRQEPTPVDGGWCAWGPCIDLWRERECACPRPAFGGQMCQGLAMDHCSSAGWAQGGCTCDGKECGNDGCGNNCLPGCPGNGGGFTWNCVNNQCVCGNGDTTACHATGCGGYNPPTCLCTDPTPEAFCNGAHQCQCRATSPCSNPGCVADGTEISPGVPNPCNQYNNCASAWCTCATGWNCQSGSCCDNTSCNALAPSCVNGDTTIGTTPCGNACTKGGTNAFKVATCCGSASPSCDDKVGEDAANCPSDCLVGNFCTAATPPTQVVTFSNNGSCRSGAGTLYTPCPQPGAAPPAYCINAGCATAGGQCQPCPGGQGWTATGTSGGTTITVTCDNTGNATLNVCSPACAAGWVCQGGVCRQPNCNNKCEGGSDGAGGQCYSACGANKCCSAQACVADGRAANTCGTDNCGASYDNCAAFRYCVSGSCLSSSGHPTANTYDEGCASTCAALGKSPYGGTACRGGDWIGCPGACHSTSSYTGDPAQLDGGTWYCGAVHDANHLLIGCFCV